MPVSKKELFNAALSKVTRDMIDSVDEDSTEAKFCRELYPTALSDVLIEHSWTSQVKLVLLVKLELAPDHAYANRFQLPADFSRLIQAYYDSSKDSFDFEWEVRGKELWTNSAAVYIKYVAWPQSTEAMNGAIIMALTQRLAILLAFPLSADGDREDQLLKQYETIYLPRSKAIDSMESRYVEFEEEPLIEAMMNPTL